MKVNKRIVGAMVGVSLVLAGLGVSSVFAQRPTPPMSPVAVQQEAGPDDQVQVPSYTGSIVVDRAQYESMSEADEAAALQG